MKIQFGVLDRFKNFKALVENHIGKNIKAIMCDGGGNIIPKISMCFAKKMVLEKKPSLHIFESLCFAIIKIITI